MSVYGSNNGEILGWNGLSYDEQRVSIVKEIVRARFDKLLAGELRFDNIKVFVKQEAHKLKKLENGDYRLISAVSLIDTFIDRILLGWLGRIVVQTAGQTPCLVGWSPVRGGWHQLSDRFRNKPVVCLDRSAWDWTVQGYLVDMWYEFICGLAINAPQWWRDMVRLRFEALFDKAIFQFEDGTIVHQERRGVMKSGCYLTIILNSVSQSMLHYLANARCGQPMAQNQPYTIGDDTVQDSFDYLQEYAERLEELGPILKGVKVRHFVEFAGFAYDGKTCWPAYWQKHLFNLAHTTELAATLESYQYLYVHEPVMYRFICKIASELGPERVLPRIVALDIMDNPS